MSFTRHTDADKALLAIALMMMQEDFGDETPDVAIDPIGLTTHGIQDFRPFFIQSIDTFGAGCYGPKEVRVRRSRIMVASGAITLASRKKLRLSKLKIVGMLGAMPKIARLIDNGADLGKGFRNGMPTKISDVLKGALEAAGYAVCSRKSGPKNLVFDGCVPIDADAPHVVEALAMLDALCDQFQGYLGSDPVTGIERTKTEVEDHFVGIVVKAAAKRAKIADKRKENAAANADEAKAELVAAVEDAPSVTSAHPDDPSEGDMDEQEEPTPGFTNLVIRLSDEALASLSGCAKSEGVDINDPVALGTFVEAMAVVFRDEPEQDEQVTRAS